MRSAWTLARIDLAVWRRTPWVIAAALIPPVGMTVLVFMLTLAVTRQPVALVVEDHSPQATAMVDILRTDTDTYVLYERDMAGARSLLARQEVTSIIVIPPGFGAALAAGDAKLDFTLNNIDYDFSDDIRRSLARSVAQYDAPQLGVALAKSNAASQANGQTAVPNPYRIDIAEQDLRDTDVDFLHYQILPVLLLLVINVGMLSAAVLGSRDRQRRTTKVLTVAPLSPSARVIGRLAGALAATWAVVIPATGLLVWSHQMAPPPGHWLAIAGVLGVTSLLAVGLGTLLGVAVRKPATVALASVILASYLFFLGGGFTTIAFLPPWLRALSRAVPTRYAIDALRQCLFYPDLTNVSRNLMATCAFAVAALAGSVVVLRKAQS